MSYSLGDRVTGTVSGVTDYGAFVRLPDGDTGMIHISKLSHGFVSDIRSVIKKDDIVTATVIAVSDGKIALSLIGDAPKNICGNRRSNRTDHEKNDFESMIASFKSASDERLASLNRTSRRRSGKK